MFPVMMEKTLKEYFNAKDTQGNTHNGFLTAMDFTGLSIPILNEVTVSILDAYIFNRLSRCVAMSQWAEYLNYDKNTKEFRIDAQFYSDFVNALFVELIQADKFNTSVLKHDFTSISAKDLKKITFGEKTTNRHYDNVVVEITKGNDTEGTTARTDTHSELAHTDTETLGQHTNTESTTAHTDNLTVGSHTDTHKLGERIDSETLGARTDGETLGARSDTHSETAHTDTITPSDTTTEHLRFALGGSVYNSDTKDTTTNTQVSNAYGATSGSSGIGQQINSSSIGEQENERTSGEQINMDMYGQQLNTNAYGATSKTDNLGAQENSTQYGAVSETDITGAQTITKTFGDENRETSARDDSEVIESRIDQEEHTKHVLISPEKYFEIEKELSDINAYTLFGDAVKRAFAASYWR